ncbi:MAG: HD domain-containing phosphohydrolase [Candidatus Omnitrophota bacterium]
MSNNRNEESLKAIFLLIAFACILYTILQYFGFLGAPALRLNDFFSNISLSQKTLPEEIKDIVVIAVDNNSLKKADLRWPWSRRRFAEILKIVNAGGPKAVFFDHAFLGKSDEGADSLFAEEIKRSGRVILAGYLENDEYVQPLDVLALASAGIGLVNKGILNSQDLRVREVRLVFDVSREGKKYDYGAEVKTLAMVRGALPIDIRYETGRVIFPDGFSIPVNEYGTLPINYLAAPGDFNTVSVSRFFDSSTPLDPSLFKDKIVLMGATADIIHDIHPTPLGKIPGIYINANCLLMFLSGKFLKVMPYWPERFILLALSIAIGFISLRLKVVYSFLVSSALLLMFSVGYVFLRVRYNFSMDIFSIIFLGLISYLTVEAYKYITLVIQSEKIKQQAIIDPATNLYTQRYFQLSVEPILSKTAKKRTHIFCLIYINEYQYLEEKHYRSIPRLIKILAGAINSYVDKKSLLAYYGEGAFSLCLWGADMNILEKRLSSLISGIADREFILDNQAIKLSLKISAVDIPWEHIESLADLVLTCESLGGRAAFASSAKAALTVFDPEVDKVVRAVASEDSLKAAPRNEFEYVSLDLAARNKELEKALDEIKEQQKKIERVYFQTMHSLVRALEEKDPYTAGHSERVAFYSTELAKGLSLSREEIDAVNKAAYLHDIGKIGMPDRVLHKKEKLTDEDFAYIKRHQTDGAKIFEGLPFCEKIIPYILHHHERYDGKGYPHGLSGDMIPPGAQIIAIADSFDAMTTGRGYNSPLMLDEAIVELKKSRGVQLNPAYAQRFIELLEEKKINALR